MQPGNRGTCLIKGSFAQDRIVGPFIKMHHNPVGLDFELAPGFHELAIELLGLCFVVTLQMKWRCFGSWPLCVRQCGQPYRSQYKQLP